MIVKCREGPICLTVTWYGMLINNNYTFIPYVGHKGENILTYMSVPQSIDFVFIVQSVMKAPRSFV